MAWSGTEDGSGFQRAGDQGWSGAEGRSGFPGLQNEGRSGANGIVTRQAGREITSESLA